jgi:Fe-S-cluster containining protein
MWAANSSESGDRPYDPGRVPTPLTVIQARPPRKPWYSEGLRFRCTECGNCCTGPSGYVWISPEEIGHLAEHLGRTVEDVNKRYVRKIGARFSLREKKTLEGKYDCVFLIDLPDAPGGQKRKGCGIYQVRPLQCRTWPFWDGVVETRSSWEAAARNCPGIDIGRRYSRRRIEQLRDATEWPESPPSSD